MNAEYFEMEKQNNYALYKAHMKVTKSDFYSSPILIYICKLCHNIKLLVFNVYIM